MTRAAYKIAAEVLAGGQIHLTVPLPAGTEVEVVVLGPEQSAGDDLLHAAQSSTEFWDNPIDDAEWNHVA
jgi:hypothetical protein